MAALRAVLAGTLARSRVAAVLPLRAYFIVLVALFVAAAASAALFVHVQAERDARADAVRDARFSATAAARKLDADVALLRATVGQLAANEQIAATFDDPRGCTLSFGRIGAGDRGHLDIVSADGVVFCSSRTDGRPAEGAVYGGAAWLMRANREPLLLAPVLDPGTGAQVALATAPIGGGGFVAGFLDLAAVGPALAATYGGGRLSSFLVTRGDGAIVTRSLNPERWIGTSVGATGFVPSSDELERPDLEGRNRIFASASVPGPGWTLHVGEDANDALSAARSLERRQLGIIGIGLLTFLLAAWFTHRNVVAPIRVLSTAVRETRAGNGTQRVTVAGPSEVVGLAHDVNDLVDSVTRELHARQASERNYRLLFETNPNPMWVYDTETLEFLAVNDAAVQKYGYSRAEFLAMTIEDIRTPDEIGRLRSLLDSMPSGDRGLNVSGAWRHRRKDGSALDVEVTSNALEFEGRKARVVLALDVTERKQLEDQLRQAQRLEAIGRLAGGVAHDFNNLLTVISGYADAIRSESDGAFEQELGEITAASSRASILTNQLLAFSRRQVLRYKVVDLNNVVQGVLPMLTRLIGEDIEVTTTPAERLRPVLADPNQIEQVIVNLAVNARDAMPDGGTLTISTGSAELDDEYVASHPEAQVGAHSMIAVTDTGAGMDAEMLAHIFDPFFTTKPVGVGTGLGLSTVYGIVKQTGGNVWVYSEPGQGTTFKVYLPVTDAPATEEAVPLPAEPLGGDETIVLVEDDHALRTLTARMLRTSGYTVLPAARATDALQLVAENDVDLVVTDLVMPEMGGRELAEKVAELAPSVRTLFMSGYSDEIVTRHGTLAPGSAFLEKPFSGADLGRAVRDALDRD